MDEKSHLSELQSDNHRKNIACPKCKHKHRPDGSCSCGCKESR